MKRSEHEERRRRVEWAKDDLLKAAAALVPDHRNQDTVAFAILHAAIALTHLAAADVGEEQRAKVEKYLRSIAAKR